MPPAICFAHHGGPLAQWLSSPSVCIFRYEHMFLHIFLSNTYWGVSIIAGGILRLVLAWKAYCHTLFDGLRIRLEECLHLWV
jgi:hypothetical protein